MTAERPLTHDVIVIGGGPAGATAAIRLARKGVHTLVVDRSSHPRFHIGESFLPRTTTHLEALGLATGVRAIPHVPKAGVEFVFGHGREPSVDFRFDDALGGPMPATFNIERAPFDRMLLDAARDAGATVREGATVKGIGRLDDGDVEIDVDGEPCHARWIVDASGQATVIGRHLGRRRVLPDLCKVAYYGHYTGVQRRAGDLGGYPTIVMCREGWFWIIPLDARRTSLGLVMSHDSARAAGRPAGDMLAWGLSRCPVMAARCRDAEPNGVAGVAADFSYTCRPYAGPGYFLVGDAATFLDPVFSTGVFLGMAAADYASAGLLAMIREGADPRRVRQRYTRLVDAGSSPLFRLVRGFYRHSFRELVMQRRGPLSVHRAVIALLAGDVFPRPSPALWWRLRLFELLVGLNERLRLVPARVPFSLLEAA